MIHRLSKREINVLQKIQSYISDEKLFIGKFYYFLGHSLVQFYSTIDDNLYLADIVLFNVSRHQNCDEISNPNKPLNVTNFKILKSDPLGRKGLSFEFNDKIISKKYNIYFDDIAFYARDRKL